MGMIVKDDGYTRVIEDDMNPRIHLREFKCAECGEWVAEDDAVWIDPKTGKATMDGHPYHTACGPPEKDQTFLIYFSDLNEDAKRRCLEAAGITDPKEANWDMDVIPLAEMSFDEESGEPEKWVSASELGLSEDEPYDPGPGERKVEREIRDKEIEGQFEKNMTGDIFDERYDDLEG